MVFLPAIDHSRGAPFMAGDHCSPVQQLDVASVVTKKKKKKIKKKKSPSLSLRVRSIEIVLPKLIEAG